MPRGVYARKKTDHKIVRGLKQAVKHARTPKMAASGTRRKRNPTEIPTISRSALQSSISETPTPNTGATLVSHVVTAIPDTIRQDEVQYAVFGSDGDDVDWNNHIDSGNSLDAMIASAEETANDNDEPTFVVQIVAIIERQKGTRVRRIANGPF